MVTVIEGVLQKSDVLLCLFLWAIGFNAKCINKEIFPVYDGKYLSLKAVHNHFADDEGIDTEAWKWLR
jgi:hypothetical protein